MQKTQMPRSHLPRRDTGVHDDSRTQRARERGQANKKAIESEMEEILDEIDSVLETNAQEFVESFIQEGRRMTPVAVPYGWEDPANETIGCEAFCAICGYEFQLARRGDVFVCWWCERGLANPAEAARVAIERG